MDTAVETGGWLLLASFGVAFVIGSYEHFIADGADNVFTMARGQWTVSFQVSASLLLLLDVVGCLFAAHTLFKRSRD
jgi:hypothetical protein